MIHASLPYTQQSSWILGAGEKLCLRFLDKVLKPTELARIFRTESVKEKLQALFLISVGTIPAV